MENVFTLIVEHVLMENFAVLTTRIPSPADIRNDVTENLPVCMNTLTKGLLFWAEAQDIKQIINQTIS